jgi:hypothetical protein
MRELNEWYDALPGRKRFLLFMGLVAVPVSALMAFSPPAGAFLAMAFGICRLRPDQLEAA